MVYIWCIIFFQVSACIYTLSPIFSVELYSSILFFYDDLHIDNIQYKLGKHRSNALELIEKVPPIEVEGDMAVCDGGGGALGHPLEYIKVGYRGGEPVSCVYCGLKYVQKAGGH